MGQPLTEAVDFLENIESSEDFDGTKVETKKKSASTKNKSKGSSSLWRTLLCVAWKRQP